MTTQLALPETSQAMKVPPSKYLESYPGHKIVMVNREDLEEWAKLTHKPAEPVVIQQTETDAP